MTGAPPPRRVDLHAHTLVSDGTLTPTQLVELAAREGLAALAVTDHDHVGAVGEAREAGAALGVEIVSGIELSVAHEEAGDVHLLGYFVDERDSGLLARLERLRASRARRAERIVERMNALGIDLTMEEVARHAVGGGALGRPHVARALVARGLAPSVDACFERWLGEGRPAYVPKEKLGAREAVALVARARGVAALAHAGLLADASREALVRELASAGMRGVEVWHPKNPPRVREQLEALAKELDLVATGGSDFHGENKPDVRLGCERVPYDVVERLRARRPR